MVPGYELLKEVRGKGLMIGVEFGPPKSLRLRASWNVLETASKGLFCQLITVPLFKDHKILTQVSGHGSHTIKLLPPLGIARPWKSVGAKNTFSTDLTEFEAMVAELHR
jgi:ornithine--oxo-acid transaminase